MVMEKEFIPYEQALVLKELGFDEPCLAVYNDPEFKWTRHLKGWDDHELDNVTNSIYAEDGFVTAPTFSQAFRWFREKYKLHSILEYDSDNYYFVIQGVNDFNFIIDISEDGEVYQTYEEAELECLKKLIEIVKEQK